MKPLYTKKNGTSQRVAAIEVTMPASYPSANVSYGNGSVEDALDSLIPITAATEGGVAFTVSRIYIQKYSDSSIRIIFYDDDTSHTYKNAICDFKSVSFTPR